VQYLSFRLPFFSRSSSFFPVTCLQSLMTPSLKWRAGAVQSHCGASIRRGVGQPGGDDSYANHAKIIPWGHKRPNFDALGFSQKHQPEPFWCTCSCVIATVHNHTLGPQSPNFVELGFQESDSDAEEHDYE
jgi:hypothetical protein